jgi:hypothetical protein
MAKGDRRFTFHVIRSGQAGPHKDSVTECEVLVEHVPYKGDGKEFVPNHELNEMIVKAVCKGFVPFKEPNDNPDWADPQLSSWSNVGGGRWRFAVTRAFTD